MTSTQDSERNDRSGAATAATALEAIRLGERLDANHRADAGELQSIGTCRKCGYLVFEAHGRGWRHLPSVEERSRAGKWLSMHEPAS